ncbi:hypothetical protein [Kribbella sp. CA-294648]|uniref:hypothetical protein n=1 Tax=Kribbella sp. CA-294648 TaxID=3239948 RepID=UPI003D8A8843
MYGYLVWPQLAEIEGAVSLALHGGDDAEQVVDSFNVFEVEPWRARLASAYPQRSFP